MNQDLSAFALYSDGGTGFTLIVLSLIMSAAICFKIIHKGKYLTGRQNVLAYILANLFMVGASNFIFSMVYWMTGHFYLMIGLLQFVVLFVEYKISTGIIEEFQ